VFQKNAIPLACYNFDTCERILRFFGRNVTDKVSNQNTLYYYATSNNLWFCTTWQNGKTRKLHFSLKCCISALSEFNQLLDFFNIFDSWLISRYCIYDSLTLVISAFKSGLFEARFKINEVESAAEVRLCCTHNAPVRWILAFLFRKVMQKYIHVQCESKNKALQYCP